MKRARSSYVPPSGQGYASSFPRKRLATGFSSRRANIRTGGYAGLELKFHDTSLAIELKAANDGSSGEASPETTLCLNAMGQGNTASTREGRSIDMKSIYVTGIVTASAAVAAAPKPDRQVYIALVMDKQTNGAQLSSEDVFTNPSGARHAAANPLRDLEQSKRFRVLDVARLTLKVHNVYNGTNFTAEWGDVCFSLSAKKLPKVQFLGNGATVADISDNSLHVIAFCNSDGEGDQVVGAPTMYYNSRLRFTG